MRSGIRRWLQMFYRAINQRHPEDQIADREPLILLMEMTQGLWRNYSQRTRAKGMFRVWQYLGHPVDSDAARASRLFLEELERNAP